MTMDGVEPGALDEAGDEKARSFDTNEVVNARLIGPADSHADIETKLSSSGTVLWMPGDYTSLPDRVEITASDLTLHIMDGAHIAVADDASPTLVQADNRNSPDGRWLFVLWSDGNDNVDIHNHGLIEGRRWEDGETQSTVVREFVGCIGMHNGDGCSLYNYGSDLYNTSIGASWVDCRGFEIVQPYSSALRESPAEIEGCEQFTVNSPRVVNGNECVNLNAYNEGWIVENIVADGDGAANTNAIEIEESSDGLVDGIEAHNGCSKLVVLNGEKKTGTDSNPDVTDPKFTDKSPIGNANNVTIDTPQGETTSAAISIQNGDSPNPVKNSTITNARAISQNGRALEVLANGDNNLDGLSIDGYFETQATGTRGVFLTGGGTYQNEDMDLNITAVAVDGDAVQINEFDDVSGFIRARCPSGRGVLVFCQDTFTCDGWNLTVDVKDCGGRGLHVNGPGNVTDCRFAGVSKDNTDVDLDIGVGSDCNFDVTHGDFFQADGATSRIKINGVGKNAGDPSAGNGQWAGEGSEGDVVVDTTNSVVKHYRAGSWV